MPIAWQAFRSGKKSVVNHELELYDNAVLELNEKLFFARKAHPKISQMLLILSTILTITGFCIGVFYRLKYKYDLGLRSCLISFFSNPPPKKNNRKQTQSTIIVYFQLNNI